MVRKVGSSVLAGLVLLGVVLGTAVAWAETPVKKLKYSVGTSLAAGKYNFRFSLWDNTIATTVSNVVWSERKQVTVSGGSIATYLGDTSPLDPAIFSRQLWVQVDRVPLIGKLAVIGKRGMLGMVPYAMYSLADVAASKITGTIGTSQIANGAVTSAKISGTIGNSQISGIAASKITGAIGASQIAAGAVTGAKIAAGTINISNTDSSIEAGSPYTLVVATSGGDYSSITSALNAITDATAAQPYLIKVMPGTYTESVTLKSNVHIQGSGIGITTITNTGTDVVIFSSVKNARLSQLTVNNSAGSDVRGGIRTISCGASVALDNVSAIGSSSGDTYGIYNYNSSPTITNCSATGSTSGSGQSYGICNYSSSPTISNCSATASCSSGHSYGIFNCFSSSPTVTNSHITGSYRSIYQANGRGGLGNCQLIGPVSTVGHLFGCYDENFAAITNQ